MKAKNTIGKIYVRASPPNPLSLRRGGLKLPFSPQFFCLIGGAGFQPAAAAGFEHLLIVA